MSQVSRSSRVIDFGEGRVILDPESFVAQVPKLWTLDQKIDFFECRVDVWQLGVAVEMLRQIERHQPPSIWSHAAYGLLSVITSYFEMVGKVLNPESATSRTSSRDFNWGFCDVYPSFAGTQTPRAPDYSDKAVHDVARFRDLMRNGMYHLGYPKNNFLIHNSPTIQSDFEVVHVRDQQDGQAVIGIAYLMNPHRVTRTIVDHFGRFVTSLHQASNAALRSKFEEFFDDFHEG